MANTQVLLHDLAQIRDSILNRVSRVTKNLLAVATLCTTEPAFTARMVEQLNIPTSSVYRIIDKLVDHWIIRIEHKIHGQSAWSVRALTDAFDAFAARAGRREEMNP